MARSIWKGAISFGIITIPVSLTTVVEDKDVRFKTLSRKTLKRVKQRLWDPENEEFVERADTVKGYEYSPGDYVIVDDDDFAKIQVDSLHTIEITKFVPLESD